jgi:hypothetical protein
LFNLWGFNSPPLWGVKLGVRGICSPVYAKISKRNLQYPAALPRGFFIVFYEKQVARNSGRILHFLNLKFINIVKQKNIRLRQHKKTIFMILFTVSWPDNLLFWQDKSIHVHETSVEEEFIKKIHIKTKKDAAKIFCKKISVNKKGNTEKGIGVS